MIRKSLLLRQQLRDAIKSEIADRTKVHQARIATLKVARARPLTTAGVAPISPLVLLSHGDSWFDYPLNGNGLSLDNTDIIAQLQTMGDTAPQILNVSHYGDATTEEMSWPKQERMIEALRDPDNWLSQGKPDAILFSGGGNDIAGNQFCIFLDYANTGNPGLDSARFQDALGMVKASYEDLFLFRDRNAYGVPIFGHCYDFPIPNGSHPTCAGPWLLPSLTFAGWNVVQGTAILHDALTQFKAMLANLAANAANNFVLIDTQGLLAPGGWANELHPEPEGFRKIASKFVDALRARFGPRI